MTVENDETTPEAHAAYWRGCYDRMAARNIDLSRELEQLKRKPFMPAVLVVVDRNSCLTVLQDEDVQVVLVDERVDPEIVVMVPRKNQAQLLFERLGDKHVVSKDHDLCGAAVNAITQLYRRRILVGTLVPEQEQS